MHTLIATTQSSQPVAPSALAAISQAQFSMAWETPTKNMWGFLLHFHNPIQHEDVVIQKLSLHANIVGHINKDKIENIFEYDGSQTRKIRFWALVRDPQKIQTFGNTPFHNVIVTQLLFEIKNKVIENLQRFQQIPEECDEEDKDLLDTAD